VFEPVTTGDIVYQNSETGLFERAHADDILIGKYEVTNAQYFQYWDRINRAADRTPLAIDGVIFSEYHEANPTLPVVRVDYASAQGYCEWIGGRLPTWSEWVIAANGEEDRLYAHGNDISPADANYFDSGDPFEPGPSPVGYYNGESDGFTTNDSFAKYGAYDMTGNVWEWVDRQRESFGIVEAVIMGGSFDDDQFGSNLFSQVFHWEEVSVRRANIGFRCARDR
jgi:formylglycine-generating enzyme required for sulfatase activity